MFKPSRLHHSACRDHCELALADSFGVLCWNVYKNNHKDQRFQDFLAREVNKQSIDCILFQEASFRDNHHFQLPDFSYDAAANLEFRGEFYGVLTASRVESIDAQAYLSEGRETLIGPHKSLLLSRYPFADGSSLMILNIHAINFRETKRYFKELERFFALVTQHSGPLIVAGDFNSWNKKRMDKLHQTAMQLSLTAVSFESKEKIKSFMGKDLDFVFYRGLRLVETVVMDTDRLSDHNPLFVRLEREITVMQS